MLEIKSLLIHILPYIPFLGAAVIKGTNDYNIGTLVTRLAEAGIIGGIIMYANLQVLEQKFDRVEEDIMSCETNEREYRKSIQTNREQLRELSWQLSSVIKKLDKHSDLSEK